MSIAESYAFFNRHLKVWQTIVNDIAVASFPPGPKGKRAARFEALARSCPRIHQEIHLFLKAQRDHSEILDITKRAIDAGYLLHDGHLRPPRALNELGSYVNEVATVESQRDPGQIYAICEVQNLIWCSCPDHQDGLYRARFHKQRGYAPGAPTLANGQTIDKHILAYLINLLIQFQP